MSPSFVAVDHDCIIYLALSLSPSLSFHLSISPSLVRCSLLSSYTVSNFVSLYVLLSSFLYFPLSFLRRSIFPSLSISFPCFILPSLSLLSPGVFPVRERGETFLGTDTSRCAVGLHAPHSDPVHARVNFDKQRRVFLLHDLQSRNGEYPQFYLNAGKE